MSTFNELEQQTIKEHCGDWVLYSVDELENQLAAERAKVAELQAHNTQLAKTAHAKIGSAIAVLTKADETNGGNFLAEFAAMKSKLEQSTDALADIRREVARECAEVASKKSQANEKERERYSVSSGAWLAFHSRAQAAKEIADAIRTKFGVAE